jgi:hypothetical protein
MVCLFQFCQDIALASNELLESFLLNDDTQGEPECEFSKEKRAKIEI